MQYRRLGRTGLDLSILSLGSGGPNRFGQFRYVSRKDINALVRRALDLGINYFDTASRYSDSELILGEALHGVPRDGYHLSSKIYPLHGNSVISAADARRMVEQSLRRLSVETLDILFLHKVPPEFYAESIERLMPTLQNLRTEGKIRCIGITESSTRDRQHRMLKHALQDDLFDSIMVSYQLAHGNAEEEVLPLALSKNVGVIGMLAARNLVTRTPAERLKLFSRALLGYITSPHGLKRLHSRRRKAFASLPHPGSGGEHSIPREGREGSLTLPEAGYTFAISHPAVATVLTGTTNPAHLEQNVQAAMAPMLTSGEIEQLRRLLQR